MKLLLSITVVAFLNLSFTSVDKTVEDTISSNELITFEAECAPLEGMACRTVTTSCGGGNSSRNRACVTYEGPDAQPGAVFLAHTIAREMGLAACKRMAEITSATAEVGGNN